MKVFICSKLRSRDQYKWNDAVADLCADLGFDIYLPQIELPLNTELSALQILESNEAAVDNSDILIVNFDREGAGIATELERGFMRGKTIIGYRTKGKTRDIGKMLEGFWSKIPDELRAGSINQLENILKSNK